MHDRRESDIVLSAQGGNKQAFGELVQRYQNLVTSIAYSRTGDVQRSEDIAQQAFLVAWEKRLDLLDPSRFGGWIRSIARNVTLNSNRKTNRLDRSAQTLETQHEPSTVDAPGDAMATREQQELLWQSLKNIPEEYREPLVLFYRQDKSVQQVADQMGLSVDSVKQRLSRGRAMLKSEVEQFVEDLLGSTKPSASFCSAVVALLPAVSAASGSAVGQVAIKGGTMFGAKTMLGKLGILATGPFLGAFGGLMGGAFGFAGAWYGTKMAERSATSEEEKKLLWWFFRMTVVETLAITLLILGVAFYGNASTRTAWAIGASVLYTMILSALIVTFIRRQKKLHEIHGKPEYAQTYDPAKLSSFWEVLFALGGGTFGCWAWLIIFAAMDQAWIVLSVSIVAMLGHFAWRCVSIKPMNGPDLLRFQSSAVMTNTMMVSGIVIAAGLLGTRMDYGPISYWILGGGAVAIGWFICVMMLYGARRMEKRMLKQNISSSD